MSAAEVIFRAAPTVWVPDLGTEIRGHLDTGRIVVWRSVSGAALTLANVESDGGIATVGMRSNPNDPFITDGLALVLGRLEATSCGLWSPATGYRSSRPVTVTVHEVAEIDGEAVAAEWSSTLRELGESGDGPHDWLLVVPTGHPAEACPVAHCPAAP